MLIQNFTEAYALEVKSSKPHGDVPALVCLRHYEGPVSFQHAMTPDQAIQMAAELIRLADEVEGAQA